MLEIQFRPIASRVLIGFLAAKVFPDRDEFHFGRDDAFTRVMQLGDGFARRSLSWLALQARKYLQTKTALGVGCMFEAEISVVFGLYFPALVSDGIVAFENPG